MKFAFLAVNEVNFDLFTKYEKTVHLKSLRLLRQLREFATFNDVPYEYLEPWIQWVTVHTGLSAEEHKVFRLGDPKVSGYEQLFEVLEDRQYEICAISAMNAHNKISSKQCFIPDPWTETHSDGSFWSERLTKILRQTVNDNSSGKISKKSYLILFLAIMRFTKISWYPDILRLVFKSRRSKWCKALILDVLLYNIFLTLRRDSDHSFNYLFLNGFAHIQHHYLLSSSHVNSVNINPSWYITDGIDPIKDAVLIYDKLLYDFLKRFSAETVFIATGLSQVPYPHAKFYYRLNNHEAFLESLSIDYKRVRRAMTRDFHIDFVDNNDRDSAFKSLQSVQLNGLNFFGDFSVSDKTLFCSLVYPNEINEDDEVLFGASRIKIFKYVNFVAIKNGMHSDKGYCFTNDKFAFANDEIPLCKINTYIMKNSR